MPTINSRAKLLATGLLALALGCAGAVFDAPGPDTDAAAPPAVATLGDAPSSVPHLALTQQGPERAVVREPVALWEQMEADAQTIQSAFAGEASPANTPDLEMAPPESLPLTERRDAAEASSMASTSVTKFFVPTIT